MIATGARPGDIDSQRELFTEETSTVLVFENGAVIRLSAAVAAGQLLFLTNKESRREVVAQVTRKRDFRPTSCYVEVEFSEPAPGFWGIEFPEESELVPANAQQQEAAELVRSSRTVAGKPSESAPVPSAQEVEALKEEVEKLRKQLESLQQKPAAKNSSAPTASATPPTPVTSSSSNSASQTETPGETPSKPPAMPAQSSAGSSSRASQVAPVPPAEREDSTSFEDKPFPKPQIRINRGKSAPQRSPHLKPMPRGRIRPEIVRTTLLTAALLLVAMGAAWYLHWIPLLPFAKKQSSSATPTIPSNRAPAVNIVPPKPAETHTDSAKPAPPLTAPAPQPIVTLPSRSLPATAEASKASASTVLEMPNSGRSEATGPAVPRESAITPAVSRNALPRSSSNLSEVSSVPASGSAAFMPPKLIKSVRAVASPSSLKYFDKSNTAIVTLDALVDASGHVKSTKVISGPASLYDAAMHALKQYQYAPARLRGKPAPAHVTVSINFLFEP